MLINSNGENGKIKRFGFGGGIITIFGAVIYECYRFKKSLNKLISTDVLDIDKKHPHYIYIKYSIYRESMDEIRSMEENDKNWVNVFVHPVEKWWKTIKHSIAWRLLEVAKNGDRYERMKAVHQLARIDNLKDWDYQQLAQICDYRTAISLARNSCDTRWFLSPCGYGAVREPKSLIYEMHGHFERLMSNQCVRHFYATTLNKFSILMGYEYDDSYQNGPLNRISQSDFDCLKQCLEVLIHITKNRDVVRTAVQFGILQTLMEIQKVFKSNSEIKFLLSKAMANVSLCREFAPDFYVTGWVGILSHWARDDDLRVQVTSAKALANMDVDDKFPTNYSSRIYPLYPRIRCRRQPDVDIVFVHGLLGGVFITWRQKDRNEPRLGIYGKNALFSAVSDDLFLVGDSAKCKQGDKSPVATTTMTSNNSQQQDGEATKANPNGDAMTYRDDIPLMAKKMPKNIESNISDRATKELVKTLQASASEVDPMWEIVFPDCPIEARENSKGVFSISGDKWINDDNSEEYTYCWPMDWLPSDYPNARVLGLNYESNLSEWSTSKQLNCPCEKKGTLHNRAEELLETLIESGVGRNRPVIWVGHSMGGLLLKSIIVQALEHDDPHVKALALNTQGIMFLGTPHKGSAVAKLKQHIQYILSPTIEVKELEENAAYLLNIHEKFLDYIDVAKDQVEVVSIAEGIPTVLTAFKFPIQVVTKESANLMFGDYYVLNVDHLGLSKPYFRQSFLYQRLLKIIEQVVSRSDPDVESIVSS